VSRDSDLIEDIKIVFSGHNLSGCYTADTESELYIVETDKRSYMQKTDVPVCFKIHNPKCKLIHFIAVDACFITDSYTGKYNDCIVFDDTDFCFIELKLNVISTYKRTMRKRIPGAVEQLGAMIDYFNAGFQGASKDFMSLGFNYEAYIVLPTRSYPQNTASKTNRKVKFAKKYKIKLFEDNQKTFL